MPLREFGAVGQHQLNIASKTRDTASLLTPMYIWTVVGFALWTLFGAAGGQWPIIVPNVICCGLSAFILTMNLLPKRIREKVADKLDPEGGKAKGNAASERG